MTRRPLRPTFDLAPPPWPEDPMPEIVRLVRARGTHVAVVDDDPTGTQAVHGVDVLADFGPDALEAALSTPEPSFFLLSNSRALPAAAATALARTIGQNLEVARRRAQVDVAVVSRSDSCLRGHFPAEVLALAEARGAFDGILLAPFFEEGGRFTVDDVHYIREGEELVSIDETAFAKDEAFGFSSAHLPTWVEEKSGGRFTRRDVVSLDLVRIRTGGPAAVTSFLLALEPGKVIVVNALARRDIEVVVRGLLDAEAAGKRYLYRSAATFAAVRAGIVPRPLLDSTELDSGSSAGGLVVVGSYVPKTTEQLEVLFARVPMERLELPVPELLDPARGPARIDETARRLNALLAAGRDAVLFTSRAVIRGGDATSGLAIGQKVTDALVELTRRVEVRPRFFIAKGGITSNDLATQGFGLRRARVLGPILPGVPVWRLGEETRFPGLAYVVFPGNVGDKSALADAVLRFPRARPEGPTP